MSEYRQIPSTQDL